MPKMKLPFKLSEPQKKMLLLMDKGFRFYCAIGKRGNWDCYLLKEDEKIKVAHATFNVVARAHFIDFDVAKIKDYAYLYELTPFGRRVIEDLKEEATDSLAKVE